MTQNQPQNQRPRSASEKIADLENAVMSLYQTLDNVVKDLGTIKDAIKLLGNKVDSIVKASSNGEVINDTVIARIMIENNCEELANKVKVMVAQGVLVAQDQVAKDSFVVGAELNDAGETINPRLQFGVFALNPELQDKLKGSKAGDVLNLEEGKLKFKVLETYSIKQPDQAAPAADASAPAAPVTAAPDSAPAVQDTPAASAEAPAAAPNAESDASAPADASNAPASSDAAPAASSDAPAAAPADVAPASEQAAPQA